MSNLSIKFLVLFLFCQVINIAVLALDAAIIHFGLPALTLICKEHWPVLIVVILFECTFPLFLFLHIYYAYEA